MNDPIIALEPRQLRIDAGDEAISSISIRNDGMVVESYTLSVLGEVPGLLGAVDRDHVEVYPGTIERAVVRFKIPPGSQVPAGSHPFAVRAESVLDNTRSAVAEGDLTIGEVLGVDVDIHPELSRGRWHGKHTISLINASNLDVDVSLTGSDRDSQLAFLTDPGLLHLRSGELATPKLSVKARRPVLRGSVQRHAFEVRAVSQPAIGSRAGEGTTDSISSTASGTFLQRPILPRGSILAATLAVVAVVVAAVLRSPAPPSSELATRLPATPDLAVSAVDGHSLSISWQSQPLVEHFRLHSVTPNGKVYGVSDIDGAVELLEVPGLTPATIYCFQLQAARSASTSALSPIRCATTSASDATSRSPSAPSAANPSASAEVDQANQQAAAAAEAAKQVAAAVAAIAGSATSTNEAGAASVPTGSAQAPAQSQAQTQNRGQDQEQAQEQAQGSTSVPANREPSPAQQTVQTSPPRSPVVTSVASSTRWSAVGPIIQVENKIKGYPYSYQGIGTGTRTETMYQQNLRPPAPAGKHFLVVALEIHSLATDRSIVAPNPYEFEYLYPGCGSTGCELPLAFETDFFPDPPGLMVRPPIMGYSDILLEPTQKYIVVLSAMVDDEVTADTVRLRAGGSQIRRHTVTCRYTVIQLIDPVVTSSGPSYFALSVS